MAFPSSLPTLKVTTGPWTSPGGGAPLQGRIVRLRPERAIFDPTSGTPVTADPINLVLDELGRGEEDVPAGQWYVVTFLFGFGVPAPKARRVFLPYDAATVDLDRMLAIVDAGGQTVYVPVVTSLAGLTGPVSLEDLLEVLGGVIGVLPDASVGPEKLTFDPATQAELSTVAGTLTTALAGKASLADVSGAVAALVGSAPGTLDTLQEIAVALAADQSAAAALTTAVAGKQDKATLGADVAGNATVKAAYESAVAA